MTPKSFYCRDFDCFACCSSCHEDDELGYYPIDATERLGHHFYVCCKGHEDLQKTSDEELEKIIALVGKDESRKSSSTE